MDACGQELNYVTWKFIMTYIFQPIKLHILGMCKNVRAKMLIYISDACKIRNLLFVYQFIQ